MPFIFYFTLFMFVCFENIYSTRLGAAQKKKNYTANTWKNYVLNNCININYAAWTDVFSRQLFVRSETQCELILC